MAKLHIGTALVFFVAFLLTGAYMLFSFPELYGGREEVRMMYRATHIYLLLACLLNLMTGNLLLAVELQRFNRLRGMASIVMLITPALFLLAFFTESPNYAIERPISFNTMLAMVASVALLSVCYWLERHQDSK